MAGTEIYREQERKDGREQRRLNIIQNAQEMFIENGYFQTTMAEIAERAQISRKTLYCYFKSKEEIALSLEIMVFELYRKEQKKIIEILSGTGYQKVEQYLFFLNQFFEHKSQLIRFTGIFDNFFCGEYPDKDFTHDFNILLRETNHPFCNLIQEGMKDGSIRGGQNPQYLALTIINSYLSLSQRILSRSQNLDKENLIDSRKMLKIQIELFLAAIKA